VHVVNDDGRRLAEDRGHHLVRYFWRMEIVTIWVEKGGFVDTGVRPGLRGLGYLALRLTTKLEERPGHVVVASAPVSFLLAVLSALSPHSRTLGSLRAASLQAPQPAGD
jgi:hypothetical protein